MTTILSSTRSQPDISLTQLPNFVEQARACERIATALGESSDTAWNQALYNQLNTCLAELKPGLLDPIPASIIDSFTVDTLSTHAPYFNADCTELCRYCMALSGVLSEANLDAEKERTLRDLLCGLTAYFTECMMDPRWVREAQGIAEIKYA